MMRDSVRAVVLLVAIAIGAGCAAATEQPGPAQPAFDPVGVYDFSTQAQGTPVTGTLTLRRAEDGSLTGSFTTPLTGTLPLQSVTLDGQRAVLRAATPDGDMHMHLDFEGDRITGGWELTTGLSGAVTGQRRAQGS